MTFSGYLMLRVLEYVCICFGFYIPQYLVSKVRKVDFKIDIKTLLYIAVIYSFIIVILTLYRS